MTALDLLAACAPMVAPVTLAAIVQRESGGNPLAVHDNTAGISYRPHTETEAMALASSLIALGHSVDLGMGQINSRNLSWLGQSVATIFQPCANLTATQGVLLAAWRQSGGSLPDALSIYNSGKAGRWRYAASVYAQAHAEAPVVPTIPGGRLPAWALRELPADAAAGAPGVLRGEGLRAAKPRKAVDPSQGSEAVTPAASALRPDAGAGSILIRLPIEMTQGASRESEALAP